MFLRFSLWIDSWTTYTITFSIMLSITSYSIEKRKNSIRTLPRTKMFIIDHRFRVLADMLIANIGGEAVILNPESGIYLRS